MEHITTPKVENVRLSDKWNPRKPSTGTLYLTTTHLIFVNHGVENDDASKELWLLHSLIAAVEKPLLTTSGTQLKISMANFQTAVFTIQVSTLDHVSNNTLQKNYTLPVKCSMNFIFY